jgi:hypothetical protein
MKKASSNEEFGDLPAAAPFFLAVAEVSSVFACCFAKSN